MSPEVSALLSRPNHAVVGVNRRDGAPQLTVVWYLWDGEEFSFSTTTERAKYLNLRRDPAVSLLVNDSEHAWYVVAYGVAQLGARDHAAVSRELFARYLPDRDPSAVAADPSRIVVTLRPERLLVGR
ncbi:MAG TPA: TIGR03618 family F420-dependent PPOX class oxidoreductase [Actinopolymorphaceae bacterium]|jgi:PPOX class probable F420-dependent enzyme|nr:TIGR03618 family F420-dependent PPOX class oxidoreductase [Actinopolymorphaceae bacterium]